jgi:hypothetical protein
MTSREILESWQSAGRKVVHEADAKDRRAGAET